MSLPLPDPDLHPRDPLDPLDFNPITFLAWISDVKFDRKGDMKFNITIPFEYRDSAMGIWNAVSVPLKIRVERWSGPNG